MLIRNVCMYSTCESTRRHNPEEQHRRIEHTEPVI
jgi:hypothetical protein